MIINREMKRILIDVAKQFSIVGVMGPRQSGKTTLTKETFPTYTYVSLEDLDMRLSAKEDPRKFFATYSQAVGLIIDEIQEVPELFSYLQGIVDKEYKPGFFIITGSQNFLMHEKITQTLAGRIALLTLLPLTIAELHTAKLLPDTPEEIMPKGLYPRIYAQSIDPVMWFSNYINTYVERDVRQVLQIGDVISFQKFLKLCAARIGNVVNYASLARDADISPHTAKTWLSVLESSYIIKLLQPYYKNFNKRVIKSPKLYFYDPGLACALLGIRTAQELYMHPMRGPLFETLIISELYKYHYNQGLPAPLYFWRDVQGHEIDCVVEQSYDQLVAIEIKAGMTVTSSFFKELIDWHTITNAQEQYSYLVYAGKENQERKHGHVIAWNNVKKIVIT
jgi:predicted AAA+ superfamily ATPase